MKYLTMIINDTAVKYTYEDNQAPTLSSVALSNNTRKDVYKVDMSVLFVKKIIL